ncbi:FAD:protein FMN transferase [Rubripirellula amarantea]|nr:FAD:protein FMN transferase [Rubripirellula amarantea]
MTRKRSLPLLCLLLVTLQVGFTELTLAKAWAGEIIGWSGPTMGTRYSVKLYAEPDDVDVEELQLSVDAELRDVNDEMSTYLKSSQISQFNQSESTDWFDVSQNVAKVVAFAQLVSRKTDGSFDVTVGPIVDAWNFGAGPRSNQVPSDQTLKSLQEFVGYEKLEVTVDPPRLRKTHPKVQIDLSAIAKGHGVDRVVELLNELGVENCFVEIGGEVRTSGSKSGEWWKVGIQIPDAAADEVDLAYPLSTGSGGDASMATSGDYRNYVEIDGKRYSHTIDPRTSRPIVHSLASVSIVRESCMEADAWATALNVLGPDAGPNLASTENLDAFFINRTSDGFSRVGTGTFRRYSSEQVADGKPAAKAAEGNSLWVLIAITTVAFALVLFGMAIGVIFGKKPIAGSCGGLNGTTTEDGKVSCSICSNPADACKELREKMEQGTGRKDGVL